MAITVRSRRSFLGGTAAALCANAVPVVGRAGATVPAFAFVRGRWTTLHHRLFEQAKLTGASRPREYVTGLNALVRADLERITPDDRVAWNAALATYRRRFLSTWTLDPAVTSIAEAVAAVDRGGSLAQRAIPAGIANALRSAEPIQARTFDRADRHDEGDWIARAEMGVARHGAELASKLSRIFGAPWSPDLFSVHVVPYTDPFGAYSFYAPGTRFIAVSSALPVLRETFPVIESLYHEASHSLVSPEGSPVGDAIVTAAKREHRDVPNTLWHAVIFFTVGTLVERIARRAGSGYTMMGRGPGTADLFGRVWRHEYAALARFWTPWIDGRGSLEDALEAVVSALPTSR